MYSPTIPVKFAYRLARGGIAIHLHTIEHKLIAVRSFAEEAFGGAKFYDLSAKSSTRF